MQVEIFSDVACPWCYLGKARFERALAAFPQADDVEVVYRPYQLRPDKAERPEPHHEWMAANYQSSAAGIVAGEARLVELGRAEGLTFDFERTVENNTLLAHRLLRLALLEFGPKIQAVLKDRLLTAHFAEGKDIGDRAVLADLAAEAGLDRDRAVAFLATDEGREEVLAEIELAQRTGITAVPTFVFEGKWAVQGGQPTDTFLQALEQVAKETA